MISILSFGSFIASLTLTAIYIVLVLVVVLIVMRVARDLGPVTVYTTEKRVQRDPRSVMESLKLPLEQRGIRFIHEGERLRVKATLSEIELYPITMPSPSLGFRINVEPAGIILGILLLLIPPLGILIDVLLALLVYDRYNKVSRLVEDLGL